MDSTHVTDHSSGSRYESEGVYQDLVGGSAMAIAFLTGMSNFTAAIGPLIVLHSVYDNGNARIENVGKSQSCMVSKLPIVGAVPYEERQCLDRQGGNVIDFDDSGSDCLVGA